ALRELVRHDTRFFSDEQHPARRLLDELTQRSLAFDREDSPSFGRFMRLVNEVVGHLATARIESSAPFERVLRALEKAWETQERHRRERREAKERERQLREQRDLLAER
ncbi:MAG TPA: peptidase, partial [Comamonadaceae bacterium]|nr:peptidase [Comamonadaceae bacterium]